MREQGLACILEFNRIESAEALLWFRSVYLERTYDIQFITYVSLLVVTVLAQ
jgi:hypothetical protein